MMHAKRTFGKLLTHVFLIAFGLVMIYPLIWLFFASFKSPREILGSISLFPSEWVMNSYAEGFKGTGQYTYTTFFLNTFALVIPVVVFTLISSTIVAYGFARFDFPFKKPLFALMIATLILPNAIIIIPRYIMFRTYGWLNSYLPFIVPSLFATAPFFNFMMVQFFRGIPKDLDEAATIDGCGSWGVLIRILAPVCKPALFSAGLFQFMWTWNDFFNTLIYIDSVSKYPLSLALRLSIDLEGTVAWNQVIAMSLLAILPCVLIYFFAQKYFVEGIATTGIKG